MRAVAEDIGVDAVKIGMLGDVATIEAVAARARRAARRNARRPSTRSWSPSPARGCCAEAPWRAASSSSSRGRPSSPPTSSRRACSPGDAGDDGRRGARPRRPRAGAARGRRHRRASRRRRPTCCSTARRSPSCPASAIPTARRTAPAARTPRRSRRASRSGDPLPEAARAARAVAGRAVRNGLRELGAGAGPGRRHRPRDASRSTRTRTPRRRAEAGSTSRIGFVIIAPMRFLRMKPGHGEVLLAEGDVEVPTRSAKPRRGVPRADRRRACGPRCRRRSAAAAARRSIVRSFDEVPRDADRVIFFPRAAGGR